MKYTLSYTNAKRNTLKVELLIEIKNQKDLNLQLPSWRPGRYELGNFAKNVIDFNAFNAKTGRALNVKKQTKDLWCIETKQAKQIRVSYYYYAKDLNAGSTFLNEDQLYVNPVNCLMYNADYKEASIELELKIPKNYKIASGLNFKKNKVKVADFDTLADHPFIASDQLQCDTYEYKGVKFYLWFMGICAPDFKKLKKDFMAFTKVQYNIFKSFPFNDYHFLFQIKPTFYYHGVEHLNSTVICLGPGYDLMHKNTYDELMGVSAHELFHAWNIKTIRPIEMMPYRFEQENYSTLGYVAEGVTTYYGDLCLLRSKYFSLDEYLKLLSKSLTRHMHNGGTQHMSVSEASFDTWLDGYVKGVPNRKVSIYNEGSLIALLCDVLLRKHSKNKKSLDDVLKILYDDFGKQQQGYAQKDYTNILNSLSSFNFKPFFQKFVEGKGNYLKELEKQLPHLGLEIKKTPSEHLYEFLLGLKTTKDLKITDVHTKDEELPISIGAQITHINHLKISDQKSLNGWLALFAKKASDVTLGLQLEGKTSEIQLSLANKFYHNYAIVVSSKRSKSTKTNLQLWSN